MVYQACARGGLAPYFPDDTSENADLHQFYIASDTSDYGRLSSARRFYVKAVNEEEQFMEQYVTRGDSLVGLIDASQDYQSLAVEVLSVLATMIDSGNIEDIMLYFTDMKDLAALCPFEYGPGVYLTRTVVKSLDLDLEFNDEDLCGLMEPRTPKTEHSSVINFPCDISFSPNPLPHNTPLNIEVLEKGAEVQLWTLDGIRVYQSKGLANDVVNFNVNVPGIYILRLINSTNCTYHARILIH